MRKIFVCLIASFLIPFSNVLFAQGEATMLFLKIPPSPLLNGMGQVGAALPNSEAYGFYYNPAHLGNSSQTMNFAIQFYPAKMDWLPALNFPDLTYDNLALNLGYNLKNRFKFIPFSLGLGYMQGEINYGKNIVTDDQGVPIAVFESKENYDAYGIGIGTEFYVCFSAGLTYKKINSELFPLEIGPLKAAVAKTDAIDYGFLLTVPVLKYSEKRFLKEPGSKGSVLPYFDISLGYAKTNIGDKVAYIEPYSDPIPRTAQLGYALTGGLNYNLKGTFIRLLGFDWSVDARELMVNRDGTYKEGMLGNINFVDNLLAAKSDEDVDVHRGFRLQFLDFIKFTFGNFDGEGWENPETSGFGVNARGILKALSASTKNKTMQFLADHFDFRYAHSEIDSGVDHPLTGITYESLSLVVSGF